MSPQVEAGPCAPARILFLYWGRRGAMPRFTLELGQAAMANPEIAPWLSVSRQNELYTEFHRFGDALFAVDTFTGSAGALTGLWRVPLIRRRLSAFLRRHRIEAVFDLMPHIWSPLVVSAIRRAGTRYIAVHHDAAAHPGDQTALAKRFIDTSLRQADLIVTLSEAVANQLKSGANPPNSKIATLFLPDRCHGSRPRRAVPRPGGTVRLLFLGRIMAYKGLPLFIEAAERLRSQGLKVEIGVFGEGALGNSADKLERLRAEVVNRWLGEQEIDDCLDRYDVVVLSHTEASQSGVAAAAFGAGVPVVATPVGGLAEQVVDGVTGLLADRIDAEAIARAISRLVREPGLYDTICADIERRRNERSMARFAQECANIVVRSRRPGEPIA